MHFGGISGADQKIQKEGAESPHPPPKWKLHFSGHAAYSIVGKVKYKP